MPKVVKPLNATQVKNAKAKEKEYTLTDGGGLYLRIKPTGYKQWIFNFISPTQNKRRKTGLGSYPDMTLDEARTKKLEYRNLVANKIDPIEHFKATKKELEIKNKGKIHFNIICTQWLDKQNHLAPKTLKHRKSMFINHIFPYIGKMYIMDITPEHIIDVFQKIKNKSDTASRLYTYLNSIFKLAYIKNYCTQNIMQFVEKKDILRKTPVKHRAKISKIETFTELVNAIYNYSGHFTIRNALKVILHLALRPQNLVSLEWSFIDFDKKILTIPRERMKTKNANFDDFQVPLSDEVIKILKDQRTAVSTQKLVFPNKDNPSKHINSESLNRALQLLGFNDEKRGRRQRGHSFRGSMRSIAETHNKKHGVSFQALEASLDHHIGDSTTQAYTHKANYEEELIIFFSWWSNFVVSLLDDEA